MRNILAPDSACLIVPFARSRALLALDFDGTLAPIVDDPPAASMRPLTRRLLARAAALYPCVVISGRALSDVTSRVPGLRLSGVVGNHGVEPWCATRAIHQRVRDWRLGLGQALKDEPGVEIEGKAYSLAVHFRRSPAKRRVRETVLRIMGEFARVRLVDGIEVVNVVPAEAPHKGMALELERIRLQCDTAIYVGDDQTDEDVFALASPGRLLSVRVGRKASSRAKCYIRSQSDIDALLRILIRIREDLWRVGVSNAPTS